MIKFWCMGYSFQAAISVLFELSLAREVVNNYLTRNSEIITLIIDM
jgi:hypothetical protein